jgi:hypothetical protein
MSQARRAARWLTAFAADQLMIGIVVLVMVKEMGP